MDEGRARRAPVKKAPARKNAKWQQTIKHRSPKPNPYSQVSMFYKDPGPVSGGFVATLAILIVFGLIVLFSASYATGFYNDGDSYAFIRPQTLYAVMGSFIMWGVSRIDYRWLRQFSSVLYWFVLVLLVIVLFMPEHKGCRRWIDFAIIGLKHFPTIQVSEIAKFSLILFLAHWFDSRSDHIKRFGPGVLVPVACVLPILALLFLEPHNSAMVLMICIMVSMMFAGGCSLVWFAVGAAGIGAAMGSIIVLRPGYVQERLQGWLDPFADMAGSTLQTGQSLYTIGSGGLFGVGLGNSVQKHAWLPEAPNDFIFSILCEELGFVGALLCIILFGMLIFQGVQIALKAPDRFGFLLVIGSIAQVGFQFLFNVGVVSNLLPNTGISLPFFSAGGTSLLMLMAQMGVILSVSRAGNREQIQQNARKSAKRQQEREKERRKTEAFLRRSGRQF